MDKQKILVEPQLFFCGKKAERQTNSTRAKILGLPEGQKEESPLMCEQTASFCHWGIDQAL